MQSQNKPLNWHHLPGKRHHHRNVLTVDDLPIKNDRYAGVIAKLKAGYKASYKADQAPEQDRPAKIPEDYSI